MHAGQNWIQVKILDQPDTGAFSYKIYTSFFFLFFRKNFAFVSWTSVYAMYKFSRKNANFGFRWKFLTNLTQGYFRTQLIHFFFLKSFPFLSWTSIYAIYKFSCKNADIGCRSKFFTNLTQGHFRRKFIQFFFRRIFHLFLWPLYMLSTSFQAKTPIFDPGQISWPI